MVKGLGRDQYDIRCKEDRVPVRVGHVKIPLCVKAYPLDVYAPEKRPAFARTEPLQHRH